MSCVERLTLCAVLHWTAELLDFQRICELPSGPLSDQLVATVIS